MLSSHSVIRRYTPPTCSLEILAQSSPLSRWAGRTLLKELRFRLSFDDPRVTEDKQAVLTGDRKQLEQLCDVVATYVKDFLQISTDLIALDRQTLKKQPDSTTDNSTKEQSLLRGVQASARIDEDSPSPWLQSQGMLSHELFFGSLASEKSGDRIQLSTLQLFDLATVLDKYSSDITALPELFSSGKHRAVPLWASSAAALVAVFGLSTASWQLWQKSNQTNNSVASLQDQSKTENESNQILDVVPPTSPTPKKNSIPTLKTPEPLASKEILPPPPPVDLPKPPPENVPDPSKYPLPAKAITIPPQPITKQSVAIVPNSEKKTSSSTTSASSNHTDKIATSQLTEKPKENTTKPTLPPLIPPQTSPVSSSSNSGKQPQDNSATKLRKDNSLESSSELDRSRLTASNNTRETTENLPQLTEIKRYFQQRWKPPKELKQTIEYRLVLNNDGSIQSIVPLGRASEIYLDRTNIPLMGQSFVSPLPEQQNPIVRLVFNPDGTVKTFRE